MIAEKAKESMNRLLSNKECEEADEIELDVKVPEIVKGKSSGEINNSMYFRRFASSEAGK